MATYGENASVVAKHLVHANSEIVTLVSVLAVHYEVAHGLCSGHLANDVVSEVAVH